MYLSRESKRAGKITLDPSHPAHSLFELLPSGRRYRALITRTTRHRHFLCPSNPSHEHLILNMEHTILLYNYLFTFFFSFKNVHISDLYTHNCLYYILCLCYFVHLLFVYLYIILLLSVSCRCYSVALWSFCHYKKFLICVNIPGQ